MNSLKTRELLKHNKRLIENFSYVSLLQIFILVSPLITYPYLVGVLGKDLYGVIITAQVLTSYGTIIINFGTDGVCAKYVSVNRNNTEKLSRIFSNIFFARTVLWLICLLIYIVIVCAIPEYRLHFILFVLTFGYTLNEWIFPQYLFQGLEKMKTSTLISISIKVFFICLIFFVVRDKDDYIFVPLLYSIGFLLGGIYSLWYVVRKLGISFVKPNRDEMIYYLKESSPLFATDIICTIKDKLNYFIIGSACMGNVVVYDLGVKLTAILAKPVSIISTVLFPRFAKTKNVTMFKRILLAVFCLSLVLVVLTNCFLPQISFFFLHDSIDCFPLRVFTLAPLFLSVSSFIFHNLFVAFGYNKYGFYSIIITTIGYMVILFVMFITNQMNSLIAFILLAVSCYFIELIYRLSMSFSILKKEKSIHEK